MTIRSGGAMDLTSEEIDEFDALMDASTLGAPDELADEGVPRAVQVRLNAFASHIAGTTTGDMDEPEKADYTWRDITALRDAARTAEVVSPLEENLRAWLVTLDGAVGYLPSWPHSPQNWVPHRASSEPEPWPVPSKVLASSASWLQERSMTLRRLPVAASARFDIFTARAAHHRHEPVTLPRHAPIHRAYDLWVPGYPQSPTATPGLWLWDCNSLKQRVRAPHRAVSLAILLGACRDDSHVVVGFKPLFGLGSVESPSGWAHEHEPSATTAACSLELAKLRAMRTAEQRVLECGEAGVSVCRDQDGNATVQAELDAQLLTVLGGSEVAIVVPTRLTYQSRDPYAVGMQFYPDTERNVTWTFARDLLTDGLQRGRAGLGDVQFRQEIPNGDGPMPRQLRMELSSPEGAAVLLLDSAGLTAFLRMTSDVVPLGSESLHTAKAFRELAIQVLHSHA